MKLSENKTLSLEYYTPAAGRYSGTDLQQAARADGPRRGARGGAYRWRCHTKTERVGGAP